MCGLCPERAILIPKPGRYWNIACCSGILIHWKELEGYEKRHKNNLGVRVPYKWKLTVYNLLI